MTKRLLPGQFQETGLEPRCPKAQLAFELGVILAGTNIVSVLHDDASVIARGRAAVRNRLSSLRPCGAASNDPGS